MPKANPRLDPLTAKERRNWLLDRMSGSKFVLEEEAKSAKKDPLPE